MPASHPERHPDLKLLRLTLVRELETINQYQDFFDAAQDPAIKELMSHLMFEEKEHVAELTEMLKRYDQDQLTHFGGGHAAGIGVGQADFGAGKSVGGELGVGAMTVPSADAAPAGDPRSRPQTRESSAPEAQRMDADADLHGAVPAGDPHSRPQARESSAPEVQRMDAGARSAANGTGHWTALTVGSLLGRPQ